MFISSVYGYDVENVNTFDNVNIYTVNSYLSNSDIQSMLDNAQDGTTINFVDSNYEGISLTINKKLLIKSDVGSTITSSNSDFCFKFSQQSSGSIISGFKLIQTNGNGIVVDGADNIEIANNTIVAGLNPIFINNSENSKIYGNTISDASVNGIKVQNAINLNITNNTISNSIRSGIELTNISNCNIADNYILDNKFNGISLYGNTKNNLLTHNTLYRNLNGIYISSASEGDVITANSAFNSFNDPSSELGGFETGNGILIGPDYKTVNKKQVSIYNNYLAHNENFQVKNNPNQAVMQIGANYYDSNDDSDTYVCPMLLSRILLMKVDLDSIPNGFALQIMDGNKAVDDMGTFTTKVTVDGVEREVTVTNGKAIIELDTTQEHTVEVKVGNQVIKQTVPAKSQSGEASDDGKNPEEGSSQTGGSTNTGDGSSLPSQSLYGLNQAISSGSNSSNIVRKDTSSEGELSTARGESSSVAAGEKGESKKAYELVEPAHDTSKTASDVSVIIIIAVVLLIVIFAVGFKRKNKFE